LHFQLLKLPFLFLLSLFSTSYLLHLPARATTRHTCSLRTSPRWCESSTGCLGCRGRGKGLPGSSRSRTKSCRRWKSRRPGWRSTGEGGKKKDKEVKQTFGKTVQRIQTCGRRAAKHRNETKRQNFFFHLLVKSYGKESTSSCINEYCSTFPRSRLPCAANKI